MDANNNNDASASYNDDNENAVEKFTERDLATGSVVREEFMKHYQTNPDLYYQADIDMLKEDWWWTVRFVKANQGKVEKAAKHMVDVFQWRKKFGLLERTTADLPIEFVRSAAVFPLKFDNMGRPVIYIRVKVYRKIQELTLFFRQYFVGVIDHVDRIANKKGFVLVYDFSGFGFVNMDLDILYFLFQLLHQYYPRGLQFSLVCNLPKFCKPVWNTFKLLIGETAKFFVFCDKNELKEHIPIENLPRYLGGESDFDFTENVEDTDITNCRSVHELASKYGFSQKQVEHFAKVFEPSMIEAKALVRDIQ